MITLGKKGQGTRRKTTKRASTKFDFVMIWLRRFGLVLGGFVAIIWLGAWLWVSGAAQKSYDWTSEQILLASADLGFSVENILVEGRVNTDPDVLLGLVNVEKGDPLFSFNPAEAYDLISSIAWIDKMSIQRRLPDTIYISLIERQPLALYSRKGKLVLIDASGDAITDYNLKRFARLPVIAGEGAPEHAQSLIQNLYAEQDLAPRLKIAHRIENRRWDLKMKSGVIVKLPDHDQGLALRRLMVAHEKAGILDENLLHIDLRKNDRIIVQAPNSGIQDFKVNYTNNKI